MEDIKVAICQNKPIPDKKENVAHAVSLIEKAAQNGAQLITLPEIFYYPYELLAIRGIAESDNATLEQLQHVAQKCGVYLCTGSIAEKREDGIRNTSYLLDPSGNVLLKYSKSHLFDVHFEGFRVKESVVFTAGDDIPVVKTPIGTISILICYDIRFPELARTCALQGAEIIIVPAVFTTITGPAHWHVLFRARAIENQVFLLAASQAPSDKARQTSYGHSLVVDPWGTILTEAATDETILYAELLADSLIDTRKRIPVFSQRRPDIYRVN